MNSSKRRGSKQVSKRARAEYTDPDLCESDDDILVWRALKKKMAPTLSRYPTISHKSELSEQLYQVLSQRVIKPNRYIDNELLASLGILKEVEELLNNVGWPDLLHMKELCYPQLTLDFLSYFNYSGSTGHWTFQIANINHKVSDEHVSDMFG